MKLILSLLFLLGLLHSNYAQTVESPPLIQASLLLTGTVSGDTIYCKHPMGFGKYFNRNLRMPVSGGYLETGTCKLSLLIDTTGKLVRYWIDEANNKAIGKEVLQAAKKIGKLTPTTIGGNAVYTQVNISFGFYVAEPGSQPVKRAEDIIIQGYSTTRVTIH